MKHLQILNKLSRGLVDSISHDVARLTAWEMLGPEKPHADIAASVLSQILLRWNCVLDAPVDEATPGYKDQACLALALVLHKHGFRDAALARKAMDAVDSLNRAVALSDSFHRAGPEIKQLLASTPVPLARRPARQKNTTFWRAGEAASLQIGKRFYAVYIHKVTGANEAPVVELYDFVSTRRPVARDIAGLRSRGGRYKDGVDRIQRFCVYGMRDVPDLANQFHLITGSAAPPAKEHLAEPVGLYAVSDVFRLLEDIQDSFSHA
jgi:hypothetical protein